MRNFRFCKMAVKYETTAVQNRWGLVWAVMLNLPELPFDGKAWISPGIHAAAHIASTGVQLYQSTPRVSTSKNKTGNLWCIKMLDKSSKLKCDSSEIWLRKCLFYLCILFCNFLCIHNYLCILFCDFPLITWSGKSHINISLIRRLLHT